MNNLFVTKPETEVQPVALLPLPLSSTIADPIQLEINTPEASITPKVQIPLGANDAYQIINRESLVCTRIDKLYY
jgi:hypothetical protein